MDFRPERSRLDFQQCLSSLQKSFCHFQVSLTICLIFFHSFNRTLPDNQALNSFILQFCPDNIIPFNICFKLFLPKIHSCFWHICIWTIRMSVPETSVNKNRCIIFSQINIRMPHYLIRIKTISVSLCKKQFPEIYFRSGIPGTNRRHIFTSFLRTLYVHLICPQSFLHIVQTGQVSIFCPSDPADTLLCMVLAQPE